MELKNLKKIQSIDIVYKIGILPNNVIPVIKSTNLLISPIVYLIVQEELEMKGSHSMVPLYFSQVTNNYISLEKDFILRSVPGLEEKAENLIRLI